MNNRIQLLLDIKDVTASKFATMIGVQPSNISHILSGRNKPSLEFISKVVQAFPDISLDWLILGKGNMYNQINSPTIDEISLLKKEIEKINNTKSSQQVDLFSGIINEEPPKIEKSDNIFVEIDNKVEHSQIDNTEHKETIEEPLTNQVLKSNIEEQKEVLIKNDTQETSINDSQKTNFETKFTEQSSNLPLFLSKEKPERIIFIYADSSFEIIENRKLTK